MSASSTAGTRSWACPPCVRTTIGKRSALFQSREAREFLRSSGLQIGALLLNDAFREIAEIEQTEGLVRPITMNMIGLILARSAVSDSPNLPKRRAGGGLILGYLRHAIRSTGAPEQSRAILRAMITAAGTRQPKRVAELAPQTGLNPDAVAGCLLNLGNQGLVRRIEEQGNVWEVSHDFVARLLTHVLATWRTGLLGKIRPWLVPAAPAVGDRLFCRAGRNSHSLVFGDPAQRNRAT